MIVIIRAEPLWPVSLSNALKSQYAPNKSQKAQYDNSAGAPEVQKNDMHVASLRTMLGIAGRFFLVR